MALVVVIALLARGGPGPVQVQGQRGDPGDLTQGRMYRETSRRHGQVWFAPVNVSVPAAPLSLPRAIGLIYPLGSAFPVHRAPPQRASVHS